MTKKTLSSKTVKRFFLKEDQSQVYLVSVIKFYLDFRIWNIIQPPELTL